MDFWNLITALSLGLALSAACGFRVFVPLLAMSIASRAGLVELGESWVWISETWVLIAFAAATLLEIGAYYIPWVDNLLDSVTTPAAVVAGVLVSAASLGQIEDVSPALQWMLAVIGGEFAFFLGAQHRDAVDGLNVGVDVAELPGQHRRRERQRTCRSGLSGRRAHDIRKGHSVAHVRNSL